MACDLDRGKPVMTAVRLLTKFVTLMSGIPKWEQPEKFAQVVVVFYNQNYLRWYSG